MRVLAATAASWLVAAPALAHHGGSIGRIDATPATFGTPPLPPPRITPTVGYMYARFGRLLEGTADFQGEGQGAVDVHLALLGLSGALQSGTEIGILLPVGVSRTSLEDQDALTSTGLGDMKLWASQDLGRLLFPDASRVGLRVSAGLVLPSGVYDPQTQVRVSSLETSPDGGLEFLLYDTQSSLGAGTTALEAGAVLGWRLWERASVFTEADVRQPLHETPDQIFWGTDMRTRLAAQVWPWVRRLAVRAGLRYAHHTPDRIPLPGAESEDGRRFVGGRDELSVEARILAHFLPWFGCGVQARLPIWQRVGGVQLVESFSTHLECSVSFGA